MSTGIINKRMLAGVLTKLKAAEKQLAKDRDVLRDLLSEYETILESATDAHQSLEYSIDRLSEYL